MLFFKEEENAITTTTTTEQLELLVHNKEMPMQEEMIGENIMMMEVHKNTIPIQENLKSNEGIEAIRENLKFVNRGVMSNRCKATTNDRTV